MMKRITSYVIEENNFITMQEQKDKFGPEITPQVSTPEVGQTTEEQPSIAVINGALEILEQEEREDKDVDDEKEKNPTIH